MLDPIVPGPDCETMLEVRAGVDQIDRELVRLLTRRFEYMSAAARIKTSRDAVRDDVRKAQVISNAVAASAAQGLPTDLIASLWEVLVEGSIAFEMVRFDELNGADQPRR